MFFCGHNLPIMIWLSNLLIKNVPYEGYFSHAHSIRYLFLYPRSTGGGYTVLPLSILLSVCPSVCPKIFVVAFFSATIDGRNLIFGQASYRYPISWEAFLDPSHSYFLFAEERGYHKWALAHSSFIMSYVIDLDIVHYYIFNNLMIVLFSKC